MVGHHARFNQIRGNGRMNLRAIANGAITSVNPNLPAVLKLNDGYTTDATGKRKSGYSEHPVTVQTQTLSTQDLSLFEGLAQQGTLLYAYVTGQFHGLRRQDGKGADKLVFAAYGETETTEWLVKQVVESWPDWCKVLLWRQH
nr:MAG TPA: head closure knob [Caudoviricetes sp.]